MGNKKLVLVNILVQLKVEFNLHSTFERDGGGEKRRRKKTTIIMTISYFPINLATLIDVPSSLICFKTTNQNPSKYWFAEGYPKLRDRDKKRRLMVLVISFINANSLGKQGSGRRKRSKKKFGLESIRCVSGVGTRIKAFSPRWKPNKRKRENLSHHGIDLCQKGSWRFARLITWSFHIFSLSFSVFLSFLPLSLPSAFFIIFIFVQVSFLPNKKQRSFSI